MKKCITCQTTETAKWYKNGTMCRSCFRKQPHIKTKELATSKVCCARYRQNNKQYLAQKSQQWVEKNREHHLKYQKQYRINNRDKKREWERNDRKNNIERRLADNLRNRLNISIKKNIRSGSAVRDLGCSTEELKTYLESKFQPGMSWDNWSRNGWHIDHIKPLASFNLSNPEELKMACNYTNLQPLWAKDNLSKGDRLRVET